MPKIARSVQAITGWNSELRILRVADVIYHWRRGRDVLPGAATPRQQRILVNLAWKKAIEWKLRAHPERVTDEERAVLADRP